MDRQKTLCLQCSEELQGRSDKKFCNVQCKSGYNNMARSDDEKNIQYINKAIRRNRTILKQLSPIGKNSVRKELMQELGFSFQYFSSIFKNQAGDIYYLCYDYGFHPFTQKGVERALIIQKQEYMKEPNLWK